MWSRSSVCILHSHSLLKSLKPVFASAESTKISEDNYILYFPNPYAPGLFVYTSNKHLLSLSHVSWNKGIRIQITVPKDPTVSYHWAVLKNLLELALLSMKIPFFCFSPYCSDYSILFLTVLLPAPLNRIFLPCSVPGPLFCLSTLSLEIASVLLASIKMMIICPQA